MNDSQHDLIGESPEFQSILRAARMVAATDVNVLLAGERGTGRKLLGRTIHRDSRRADQPFVVLNCTGLKDEPAATELTGAGPGSVADAVSAASGGTLFLDEVDALPTGAQTRLLRFLQSSEAGPGDTGQDRPLQVRVMAATAGDLLQEVRRDRFNEALYYRLNVVPLEIPPLRERGTDVVLLLQEFTNRLAATYGAQAPRYHRSCLKLLRTYPWPGNIPELHNLCQRMAVLFAGCEVREENLPREMREPGATSLPGAGTYPLPTTGIKLDDVEADFIRQALDMAQGNRSKAARLLGLTRDTLLYRLKKYAIST